MADEKNDLIFAVLYLRREMLTIEHTLMEAEIEALDVRQRAAIATAEGREVSGEAAGPQADLTALEAGGDIATAMRSGRRWSDVELEALRRRVASFKAALAILEGADSA